MALEITKEDLVKAMPIVSAPANTTSQILQFLNTPSVQIVVQRLLDRFMPPKQNESSQSKDASVQVMPSVSIKDKLGIITEFLLKIPDEMTSKDIKSEVEKMKQNLGV